MENPLRGPIGNPLKSEAAAFALLVRVALAIGLIIAVVLVARAL